MSQSSTLGTNDILVVDWAGQSITGNYSTTIAGNLTASRALGGARQTMQLTNSSSSANSHANYRANVVANGTSDPFSTYTVTGGLDWSIGVDQSDFNRFKIARGSRK